MLQKTVDAVLELREGMRKVFVERRNIYPGRRMDSNGNVDHVPSCVTTIVPCNRMSAV